MKRFHDRADAGRQLAAALESVADPRAIVFGIPRGGVVVAAEVARVCGLPLAAAVVRKLGAPHQEEYAVGAIADGVRILNPDAVRHGGVTPEQLASVEKSERVELERRTGLFAASLPSVSGRTAIVVDDGIATGATAMAACTALRAHGPARIILAVPVAPARWLPDPDVVDDFICLHPVRDFWAVGQFYTDFTQTGDGEVARLLSRDLPAPE
ncbi:MULTISPECIES: phosphoribosyltransferase family protein [unclassified Microbacterium]|uniref:phosphoribosyltransferase n=1 Tax=unclassified Microbacterium TaxID=2609290 RepID=UPI00214BCC60|nr:MULTISPECIES: phosphoribosyltransferase family protein [unclassified Microbacterium]MCR2809923.1 phosphoribosyltransferase family protein [Microbacterium sp. zg.B185]WIM17771.1 phosphoribosyltransferase family protein [Microbacterium sp. zg-B185]